MLLLLVAGQLEPSVLQIVADVKRKVGYRFNQPTVTSNLLEIAGERL